MPNTASIRLKQRRAPSDQPGWEVGSSALGVGILPTLFRTVSDKTTPYTVVNGITKDDRNLVVVQNTLSGIGRYRSQFNVSASGVNPARYYITKTISETGSVSYDVSVSFDVSGTLYDELITLGTSNPTLVENLLKASISIMYGVNPDDIIIFSYEFNSIDVEFNCRGDPNIITPSFLSNIDKTRGANSFISAANDTNAFSYTWLINHLLINNISISILKTEWDGSVVPEGPYGRYTGFSSNIMEARSPFLLLYGLSFGNTTQNNTHNNIYIAYILSHKCGDKIDLYCGFKDTNYFIKTNPHHWEIQIYTDTIASEWVQFFNVGIGEGSQYEITMLKAISADTNFIAILLSKEPYNYIFRKV